MEDRMLIMLRKHNLELIELYSRRLNRNIEGIDFESMTLQKLGVIAEELRRIYMRQYRETILNK